MLKEKYIFFLNPHSIRVGQGGSAHYHLYLFLVPTLHEYSSISFLYSYFTSILTLSSDMATPPNPPSSSAELTHTVIFGSISRILAVQEVKPGVNVAVFNILGDWEVNEAIGAELAPLVPAGTDMLLMPDGKVHVELE